MNILASIIVPVYNEQETIISVLEKINKVFNSISTFEIIVVNDCSNDKTENALLQNPTLYNKLINNKINIGKGGSIKKALQEASGKYVFFQDADNEYDPVDFIKFVKLIKRYDPDLIIGSRFIYSEYTRSHYFFNKIGNMIITFIFNILYNCTFTDIYSCYIVFKRSLLESGQLKSSGFEQQAEILGKLVRKGKKFYEIPISYNGRTFEEGKKIKFYHIFLVIYQIIKNRFF
jgi:glycosyltransferase involved in cell wall biosynthesis